LGVAVGVPWGYWGTGFSPAFVGPIIAEPFVAVPDAVWSDAAPTTLIERDPGYRYYCPSPAGFFPEVPNCGVDWLKVVPDRPAAAAPQNAPAAPYYGPPASPQ
jgi:hypothetical protein